MIRIITLILLLFTYNANAEEWPGQCQKWIIQPGSYPMSQATPFYRYPTPVIVTNDPYNYQGYTMGDAYLDTKPVTCGSWYLYWWNGSTWGVKGTITNKCFESSNWYDSTLPTTGCAPICTPPEYLNPVTNACQECETGRFLEPSGECAPWCDYSSPIRVPGLLAAGANCVQPDCGEGEELLNGICQNRCQYPEELNPINGTCWLPPCPEGQTRDIEDVCADEDGLCPDRTYKDENGLCPENYCPSGSPRDQYGRCQDDYCSDGSVKPESGVCPEPPEECWDGSDKPEDGECPPDPRCGEGYEFDVELDECVKKQGGCGDGMHEDQYGNCVPDVPDCPEGKVLWNGNCVDPEPTPPGVEPCPIGEYRVNGECVEPDDNEGPGAGTGGSGGNTGTGGSPSGEGGEGDDPGGKEEGDKDGKTGYWGDQPGKTGVEKGYSGGREYDYTPIRNAVNAFENNSFLTGINKLQAMYSSLSSTGQAPVFKIPFSGRELVIDFSIVDPAADILRIMLTLLIYSGLIWLIAKQWRML